MSGQSRAMTREALDIILRLWTDEAPFDYQGTYWQVSALDRPEDIFLLLPDEVRVPARTLPRSDLTATPGTDPAADEAARARLPVWTCCRARARAGSGV